MRKYENGDPCSFRRELRNVRHKTPSQGLIFRMKETYAETTQRLTHLDNSLVSVSQCVDGNPRTEIEVFFPIHIPDVGTFAMGEHKVRSRVHGKEVLVREGKILSSSLGERCWWCMSWLKISL